VKPVDISIPDTARVLFNSLYRTTDPLWLRQDLLAVKLQNGIVIDVSWHPARDPSGSYTVTAFQDTWDKPICEAETTDIDTVVRIVETWAWLYTYPVRQVSSAPIGKGTNFTTATFTEWANVPTSSTQVQMSGFISAGSTRALVVPNA
jgi:hypothetical protein